jgi:hypothetical protein
MKSETNKTQNQTLWYSGEHLGLIFRRYWVCMSAWKPTTLTEVFHYFLQVPQTNYVTAGEDGHILWT